MFLELVVLAITLYIVWTLQDNFFPGKKYPPGPFRLPILGSVFTLLGNPQNPPFIKFRDLAKQYGPVVFLRMGSQDTVILDDFDTSKIMLNNEIWVDRPFDDFMAERSYGKCLGVIFSSGDNWREMRRFSMRTLKDFGFGRQTHMQEIMDDELKHLLEKIEETSNKPDPVLSIKHLFTMPVLNILWSLVTSVRSSGDDKKLKKLSMIVDELTSATPIGGSILDLYPGLRHFFPDLTGATLIRKCVRALQEYFQDVLDSRRQEGISDEEGRDFMDMFIKEIEKHKNLKSEPNLYTDEQFITTVTDLFEAGSETSRNTLEFAVYFVMTNPRVQRKIQEEIDTVVGRSRLPTTLDRPQLPYSEATMLEVQRMANVLPMTVRSPTENCTIEGYPMKKGTIGIVNIYSIHMDEGFWGDPFVFRPERFLDANNKIIQQKANRVIPFGAGKRVCIGEQMARATIFTYLTSILQSYNFEQVSSPTEEKGKYADPERYLFEKVTHVGFTLSPYPYQAKITKR